VIAQKSPEDRNHIKLSSGRQKFRLVWKNAHLQVIAHKIAKNEVFGSIAQLLLDVYTTNVK
jgi:hypothetical protein